MDTKYFQQAIAEAFTKGLSISKKVSDLSMAEFSALLRRAQELKDADQRTSAVLDRMGA